MDSAGKSAKALRLQHICWGAELLCSQMRVMSMTWRARCSVKPQMWRSLWADASRPGWAEQADSAKRWGAVRPVWAQKDVVEGKATVGPVRVVIGEIKMSIGSPIIQGLAQS
jgi:hypothetical protein